MAVVKQRGSSWQYTISRYTNGKYDPIRKGGFKTKKECEIAAAETEIKLSKGMEVKTKNKSFAEYFEEWVQTYKGTKHKNTVSRYTDSTNQVKKYFKDKPIQKISRAEYQRFLNEYGKGRTKETVRKLNTHIRACVKDAIEEGYIGVDFTRKIEIHGTKEAKKSEEKHINFEESKKLIHYLLSILDVKTPTYHLILLAIISGMRYGELMGLTKESFNFKTNQVNIYRAWDYKNGDGFGPLKNEQSERKILIDKQYMVEFKKLILAQSETPYGLIFHSRSSVGCITNEGANKVLSRILRDLGIERITMHGLRHTHASVLLYQGVNIQSVSRRLGHADIQTTLDHYAHVLKEMEERDESISAKVFADMRIG